MRRSAFPYDTNYPGEPLPVARVEFRKTSGRRGVVLDDVILDTGSDASALPAADCLMLKLDPNAGRPVYMSGVGGGMTQTTQYTILVLIDGMEYDCQLQVEASGTERILGRDVLNSLEVLFRGPAAEVIINP
jgi:hypothetical protein